MLSDFLYDENKEDKVLAVDICQEASNMAGYKGEEIDIDYLTSHYDNEYYYEKDREEAEEREPTSIYVKITGEDRYAFPEGLAIIANDTNRDIDERGIAASLLAHTSLDRDSCRIEIDNAAFDKDVYIEKLYDNDVQIDVRDDFEKVQKPFNIGMDNERALEKDEYREIALAHEHDAGDRSPSLEYPAQALDILKEAMDKADCPEQDLRLNYAEGYSVSIMSTISAEDYYGHEVDAEPISINIQVPGHDLYALPEALSDIANNEERDLEDRATAAAMLSQMSLNNHGKCEIEIDYACESVDNYKDILDKGIQLDVKTYEYDKDTDKEHIVDSRTFGIGMDNERLVEINREDSVIDKAYFANDNVIVLAKAQDGQSAPCMQTPSHDFEVCMQPIDDKNNYQITCREDVKDVLCKEIENFANPTCEKDVGDYKTFVVNIPNNLSYSLMDDVNKASDIAYDVKADRDKNVERDIEKDIDKDIDR